MILRWFIFFLNIIQDLLKSFFFDLFIKNCKPGEEGGTGNERFIAIGSRKNLCRCFAGYINVVAENFFIRSYLSIVAQTCLAEVKAVKWRERARLAQAGLACSFQSAEFTDCWERATMPKESVPELPSISLQFWSTWLLKFSSWQVMPRETTRKLGSFQDIFS